MEQRIEVTSLDKALRDIGLHDKNLQPVQSITNENDSPNNGLLYAPHLNLICILEHSVRIPRTFNSPMIWPASVVAFVEDITRRLAENSEASPDKSSSGHDCAR